jgi:hypothetical protein
MPEHRLPPLSRGFFPASLSSPDYVLLERIYRVTLFAVLAELPLVNIIILVARKTVPWRAAVLGHRLLVAKQTLDPGVRSFQLVLGLGVVVEFP